MTIIAIAIAVQHSNNFFFLTVQGRAIKKGGERGGKKAFMTLLKINL